MLARLSSAVRPHALCGVASAARAPFATDIHQTAVVHPSARVGSDVTIGPYCTVGPGKGTRCPCTRATCNNATTSLPALAGLLPPCSPRLPIAPADVTIGAGVTLKSHVCVEGTTTIGEGCTVSAFSVIGQAPQVSRAASHCLCRHLRALVSVGCRRQACLVASEVG